MSGQSLAQISGHMWIIPEEVSSKDFVGIFVWVSLSSRQFLEVRCWFLTSLGWRCLTSMGQTGFYLQVSA